MKKYYKFFGPFLDAQERWLNKKAAEGLRLIETGKLCYVFEPCEQSEYQYKVEFAGGLPYKALLKYKAFLEQLGYQVFMKNLNLNFSIGKVRWRPWGEGEGQVATSPGSYGKELLILERENDGLPFEPYSNYKDRAAYVRRLRNMHITTALMFVVGTALLAWRAYKGYGPIYAPVVFGIVTLLMWLPVLNYAILLKRLTEESKLQE